MSSPLPVSQFQRGVIEARSFKGDAPTPELDHYDVAVLFVSWDPRCLNPILAGITATTTILVRFDYGGLTDANERHGEALSDFAKEASDRVVTVSGDSLDTETLWPQLEAAFVDVVSEARGPVAVYLDLSAACRYYALALVATSLSGRARQVTITYSEAHYPAEESEADKHEMFTLGKWESLPVPGLEGKWDPVEQVTWLVSLGFEGSKTFRAVSREDPDLVRVLVPDPGFEVGYVERTLSRNRSLVEEYAIPEWAILRAAAADAVDAWRVVDHSGGVLGPNLSLVCAGTKPHALGFALHSLSAGTPAVLYLKPALHKETKIVSTSSFWTYEIRDQSFA